MTNEIQQHLNLLGLRVEDVVTRYAGVVTSVTFDLYGCVQGLVSPPADTDGEVKGGHWFDVSRLEVKHRIPVMPPPNFASGPVAKGLKGAAAKPAPRA